MSHNTRRVIQNIDIFDEFSKIRGAVIFSCRKWLNQFETAGHNTATSMVFVIPLTGNQSRLLVSQI